MGVGDLTKEPSSASLWQWEGCGRYPKATLRAIIVSCPPGGKNSTSWEIFLPPHFSFHKLE